MRWLTVGALMVCVAIALGADIQDGHFVQDKAAKKAENKKELLSESLVEKYDAKLAKTVKELLLFEGGPVSLKEKAAMLAKSLNSTEEFFTLHDNLVALLVKEKLEKKIIDEERERGKKLRSLILQLHNSEVKFIHSLNELAKAKNRFDDINPEKGYRIYWSKGKWIAKQVELKSA